MRPCCGRLGRRPYMMIIALFTAGLFLYLIYALIHPEKF
ncbi:K(+)-transporting ATPase subunit F [Paenibacillus chitinolyticus]|uniref:K(+)-transporting ATPase subunit F n=1 Tax=Paenibacillus chitinolyticus TaxID=79263 RepID=A0A410WRU6_9BACL|nr:K(+)-transporting ATPase subunit F [Paenibacillus chitinolyticus]